MQLSFKTNTDFNHTYNCIAVDLYVQQNGVKIYEFTILGNGIVEMGIGDMPKEEYIDLLTEIRDHEDFKAIIDKYASTSAVCINRQFTDRINLTIGWFNELEELRERLS